MSVVAPEGLRLIARHEEDDPIRLARYYAALAGTIETYAITGMPKQKSGGLDALLGAIKKEPEVGSISLINKAGVEFSMRRPDDVWLVSVDSWERNYTKKWVEALARWCNLLAELAEVSGLAISRHQTTRTSFVPEPPIARANHLVVTTEDDVAAAYGDPETFWRQWDVKKLDRVRRLCTRALGEIDEASWLAYTFESTMEMVRAAKPKLTVYNPPYWDREFAPWWEPGDIDDEKAGHRAIAPIGYHEDTHCYEMTGFLTKTPLRKGGPGARHVLVSEIYDVRRLVQGKKDPNGRRVDAVHIHFPEKWMAVQERRPLLDAGARVFYGEGAGTEVTD